MSHPLDMKEEIEFYRSVAESAEKNLGELFVSSGWTEEEFLDRGYRIVDPGSHIELAKSEIYGVLNAFPEPARRRAALSGIYGLPDAWFCQTEDCSLVLTRKMPEAMFPTAIVPAHYGPPKSDDYFAEMFPKYPLPQGENSRIRIFGLREARTDGHFDMLTARIIQTQALIHDYMQVINWPGRTDANGSSQSLMLQFPDGKRLSVTDALYEFGDLMANNQPISNYSSFYWSPCVNGVGPKNGATLLSAIDDEMAESAAAYFLRFTFSPDGEGNTKPFNDRQEILAYLLQYLDAELIG